MADIIEQRASDVRIQEINMSQVITSASTAVACQVVVSNQGSPDPKFFATADSYLAEYGDPNAAISFDVYCGLDFFSEGNAMWARRAVHSDARYAGVMMYSDGTDTGLAPATGGIADPSNPDWEALVPVPTDTPLALFYPIRGQGSYAHSLAIGIESLNVNTPTNFAASSSVSGGSLPPATYQYQIAALGDDGVTLASAPVVVVIVGGSVTNSVVLTWDPVPLAKGYVIYGRTTSESSIGEIATIGQGTYTFTDTGAVSPDITKKPVVSPADLGPRNPAFMVKVYDTNVSKTNPMETFTCTLAGGVDSSGVATELEERINPFSEYIQVTSNVPALLTIPEVHTVPAVNMAGGDSGTAPTASDIANAYGIFKNKQLYRINTLINGGHANPTVQLAMDAVAQSRSDTIAALDVPSAQQKFQQAINYRNLTLNLNSSYSALFCPDVLEDDRINGKQVYVPFSGWAAALCARTDRVANPSFSIAGLNRGLVGVLKTRHTYEDGEATQLFKARVNYTRTFVGQGIALWEQQTLSAQDSALQWLSVRRIVNVIKTATYSFLLYALQEPNDDFTGRQITGSLEAYLGAIKDARGLSDYRVVSDSTNNSAAMFNSGIRRVTVVLVPQIPIHEIELQIVISKQGVTFSEVLRQVNGQS